MNEGRDYLSLMIIQCHEWDGEGGPRGKKVVFGKNTVSAKSKR